MVCSITIIIEPTAGQGSAVECCLALLQINALSAGKPAWRLSRQHLLTLLTVASTSALLVAPQAQRIAKNTKNTFVPGGRNL